MAGKNIVIGESGSGGGSGGGTLINGWLRPSEWPNTDHLWSDPTQNKIVMLAAVSKNTPDLVPVWFQVTTSSGATITIDWGDGTSDNSVTSLNGFHLYDKSNSTLIDTDLGYKIAVIVVTSSSNAISNLAFAQPSSSGTYHFNTNSVQGLPLLEIDIRSTALTLSNKFTNLYQTEHIRIRNFGNGIAQSAFANCHSLKAVEFIETAATKPITTAFGMFQYCYSLIEAPTLNLLTCSSLQAAFQLCMSLKYVPDYNTAACTSFMSAFNSCSSLEKAPMLNFQVATTTQGAFSQCKRLVEVPAYDMSNVTTFGTMFQGCANLRRCAITNIPDLPTEAQNIFAQCVMLGADALNEIYTNLPTTSSGTLVVNQCVGKSQADDTIATDKGWTLTK